MNLKTKELIVIIGSLEVGGTERHLVRVLSKLIHYGWKSKVYTLTRKGSLAKELEEKGVPVISIFTEKEINFIAKMPKLLGRSLRIFLCIMRLQRELRRNKEALLHFYLPEAYVLGMIAVMVAQFSGHKLMSRRSLNLYQSRRPGLAWIEKKFHSKMDLIIGNSHAVLHDLETKENVPKEQLRLIYNGINIEPFTSARSKDEMRRELNIERDAYVMIIVANLIPYKGHSDLLNALGKIKNKIVKKWTLLVVGRDDGIGDTLKTQARVLGISDSVLWLGMRNDVTDLLKCADMGILCSHEEGFSNAIIEGMAAGLPMVVTDVGGNSEAVISNKTGYVVPKQNPEALAMAILELANNPEKSLDFGKEAFVRAKEKFSLESCIKAYVELYNFIIDEGKKKCVV